LKFWYKFSGFCWKYFLYNFTHSVSLFRKDFNNGKWRKHCALKYSIFKPSTNILIHAFRWTYFIEKN
jgi:hypothetical protein